jgi:hypothetical protein
MNILRGVRFIGAALLCFVFSAAAAPDGAVAVVTRDGMEPASELIEITGDGVVVRRADGQTRRFDVGACVGFIHLAGPMDMPAARGSSAGEGMLGLADGQRFPGEPVPSPAPASGDLSWRHPWFGELSIDFDRIAWVVFRPPFEPPAATDADVVLLANGDRVEGFVEQIGDPIELDVDGAPVRIPFDRAVAMRLVNPRRDPQPGAMRVWLRNGTIVDTPGLRYDNADGLLEVRPITAGDAVVKDVSLSHVAGALFNPAALTALASIPPSDVSGPPARYVTPPPSVDPAPAALGLQAIQFSGPVVAHYPLPRGASRFVASARLPRESDEWADCEIIIRDDDREVFRVRLNAATPVVIVNAALRGAELTIEVAEGSHGPIRDWIILDHAMILRE